ncbi:CSGA-like protein [Mya arenaria]|uniref:CSGA-like protein n=1 Tax=Mya arenaria TaxID=6604 RepID=A0ABY7DWH8_MYAAR|nr:CSGA-like protein [Mya arenaria]
MEVNSVLVTGANRGLGLEFVKQFLSLPNSPKHVFAGCRNPDKAEAFLPLLRSAASRGGCLSVTNAAIINISTGVASITENDSGGGYPYRTSKAALNMITKNLSVDLKKDNILVAAVHPGWLKTDMGGTRATMETDEMARKLIDLMATFQSEDYTGKLYHFSGRVMPF